MLDLKRIEASKIEVVSLKDLERIDQEAKNFQIDLLALTLMKQYKMGSIFDAYYAATALNQVPDRSIISTDTVFDTIPGITRIDPREI